jgi:parallel beta-helix repeat protein
MKRQLSVLSMVLTLGLLISSCESLDPNAPQACFITPDEVYAGAPTIFNSSCSVNATSYSWSFGDGGTSTEANPTYTYAQAGTYTVTLTVSNDAGKSDDMSATVTVLAPEFLEHSGNIEADETWMKGVHVVTGDVYVDGAILTIEPGAVIRFNEGRGMYLGYHGGHSGATLIADGTADDPITFTSAAATKSAGDWDFIGFYDGASTSSSMQYCMVEYGGGYSQSYGMVYINGSAVSIGNSSFSNSESQGLSLGDGGYFESFTGNTVEDNGGAAIEIFGNYAHTIGTGNSLLSVKGIAVIGDRVEMADVSWKKQTTAYVVQGDLYLGSETGSVLTLDPGVELRMAEGTGMYIGYYDNTYGTLIAEGTQDDHIRITSSAPDVSKSAGDWDFIGFYDGAGTASSLAYCDIEYGGGYSSSYGMLYVYGSGLSMAHCSLKHSASQGINFTNDGMFTDCSTNTFEDNALVPIEIYANYAHTIGTGNTFNTGPGIKVLGDRIELAEVTWLKHATPYICDGDIYLGATTGSKLTIAPGTTVKFTESTAFYVGYYTGTFGILSAEGEVGNLITFTSSAPAGFESAGDWDGIWFYDGTSSGTILDNCLVSYGGGYSNNSGNLSIVNQTAGVPVVSNCQIQNSQAWGIYLGNNASPTLTDNIFGNNTLGDTNR